MSYLVAAELLVTQTPAGLTLAGSIDSKQPRVGGRPVPAHDAGRHPYQIPGVRLHRHTRGFNKHLTFDDIVIFGVRMLVRPRLRLQLPFKHRRLCPPALLGRYDGATVRPTALNKLTLRKLRRCTC